MAQNMAKVVKTARHLAITHIIVGFLLICFGIADRINEFRYSWTGEVCFGIWIGTWVCITGVLGIPASQREATRFRNTLCGVFMGFSITSAVLGGIIIICYSVSIAEYRRRKDRYSSPTYYYRYDNEYIRRKLKNYEAEMAISAIVLVLGIAEFVIGIWAPILCCLMKPCGCCNGASQTQQVVYTASPAGYIMTQSPDGVPVAISVQSGGGMIAIQASGPQEGQPPMVLVPGSGAAGSPPLMVQSPPYAVMPTTGFLSQEEEKPPNYA